MSTRPEITSPTEFLGTTVEELESRLATNALYDEDNKRLLEELLTENEELRKGNMTLEMENRRLQHALELDARRYRESVGAGDSDSRWDMYDWIANIDLLSDVSKEGWRIEFSEAFLRGLDDATQEHLLSGAAAGARPTARASRRRWGGRAPSSPCSGCTTRGRRSSSTT